MASDTPRIIDGELLQTAADALSAPRTTTNSFTLHAPLELLARAELLPFVDDDHTERARERFRTLAAGFVGSGEQIPRPAEIAVDGPAGALAALTDAVAAADPDSADAAACWLIDRLDAAEIASALSGPLVLEMGAAAHAPILFASYRRHPTADVRPLRGVARRLAANPDIRVEQDWLEPPGRADGAPAGFERAIAELVIDDQPGSGIFLLVDNARRAGVMAGIPRIADDDIDEAFRVLFRVAARSMIEDDPAYAPYGWTHALTIPLGIRQTLDLHDRRREAFDVATILAAGFRYGHGAAPLVGESRAPSHAPDAEQLASRAAVQHDAHLVKYTLACLHAARLDPGFATLYRRAAEHLADWWDANPAADDPLS